MERIGDLELLALLATGGVASVHVARHTGDAGFERLVAVKRVHPHLLRDPEVFAMLADEARLSALVRHPHVVGTSQVIDRDGELILVQEYVEGVSLAFLTRRAAARRAHGGWPVEAAARVVSDLLRGLGAAHEARDLRGEPLGLVHRDVSPQNVLVGADGSARLIDFGIARAEGRIAETREGIIKGKLAYLAPEQVAEGDVDRRADLFAAGVVLFELLAGRRPFEAASDAELMARIVVAAPDLGPVEARAPALVGVLERALARDRDERFATAEAFRDALVAAVTPLGDGGMRALVEELAGDELTARREEIRAAVGLAEDAAAADDDDGAADDGALAPSNAEDEPEGPPGAHLASDPSGGVTPAVPPGAPEARGRARWRWAVGALAVGALLVASVSLPRNGPPTAGTPAPSRGGGRTDLADADPSTQTMAPMPASPPPRAPASSASASPPELSSATPAAGRPATGGAGTTSPRGGAPAPRASAPASGAAVPASSARPELHGNPYGP